MRNWGLLLSIALAFLSFCGPSRAAAPDNPLLTVIYELKFDDQGNLAKVKVVKVIKPDSGFQYGSLFHSNISTQFEPSSSLNFVVERAIRYLPTHSSIRRNRCGRT